VWVRPLKDEDDVGGGTHCHSEEEDEGAEVGNEERSDHEPSVDHHVVHSRLDEGHGICHHPHLCVCVRCDAW
jgi:hypothetical protein